MIRRRIVSVTVFFILLFAAHDSFAWVKNYQIVLNGDYLLMRLSQDAFRIIEIRPDRKDVLVIDPVWDGIKLSAYCEIPKTILVKALSTSEAENPAATFFAIDTANRTCTEAMDEQGISNWLRDNMAATHLNEVKWVVPKNPHPIQEFVLKSTFIAIPLILLFGWVLLAAFVFLLWRYVRLKKQLLARAG